MKEEADNRPCDALRSACCSAARRLRAQDCAMC